MLPLRVFIERHFKGMAIRTRIWEIHGGSVSERVVAISMVMEIFLDLDLLFTEIVGGRTISISWPSIKNTGVVATVLRSCATC
jgi:hypothetical protein